MKKPIPYLVKGSPKLEPAPGWYWLTWDAVPGFTDPLEGVNMRGPYESRELAAEAINAYACESQPRPLAHSPQNSLSPTRRASYRPNL